MSDTSLPVWAFAVSVLATLLTYTSLFLQIGHVIDTVERRRRCGYSVIGKWSKHVRTKFHWKDFKWEIMYDTPHVVLARPQINSKEIFEEIGDDPKIEPADANSPEISRTLSETLTIFDKERFPSSVLKPLSKEHDGPDAETRDEMASWILLLDELTNLERFEKYYSDGQRRQLVSSGMGRAEPSQMMIHSISTPIKLKIKTRNWEFMPDVIRPIASSPIRDVLIWAHRLGMTWKIVQLSTGELLAEGNGFTLTSTLRGFGVLATFLRDDPQTNNRPSWAPTYGADTLAFGIIPSHPILDVPELDVSSDEKVVQLFSRWDVSRGKERLQLFRHQVDNDLLRSGFADIEGLIAPLVTTTRYASFSAPRLIRWPGLSHVEEWETFISRLSKYPEENDRANKGEKPTDFLHIRRLLEKLQSLDRHASLKDSGRRIFASTSTGHAVPYEQYDFQAELTRRRAFEAIHEQCCLIIKRFNALRFRPEGMPSRYSNYYELVQVYACRGMDRSKTAQERLDEHGPTDTLGFNMPLSAILTELIHVCWDNWEEYVSDLRQRGFQTEVTQTEKEGSATTVSLRTEVLQAWVAMTIKAMIWFRTVDRVRDHKPIPSDFRHCNVPIYIG